MKEPFSPSFIDNKWTILQQLNEIKKWISKLEESTDLITELPQIKETAENALALAQTNEEDIGANDGEISELNNQMARTLKIPIVRPSEIAIPSIDTNNSQNNIPLSNFGKKVYIKNYTLDLLNRNTGGVVQFQTQLFSTNNSDIVTSIFDRAYKQMCIGFSSAIGKQFIGYFTLDKNVQLLYITYIDETTGNFKSEECRIQSGTVNVVEL